MYLSFQYRAYPLRVQLPVLAHWQSELTYLWNYALGQRLDTWHREGRSLFQIEQSRSLTRWRAYDREGLGSVPSSIAHDCLMRLDLAFRAFFRRSKEGLHGRRAGIPRFRRETTSFSFQLFGDPWASGPHGTWRLQVPLLGEVPVRRHRDPPTGVPKFATLSRNADGWYVTLQYLVPDAPLRPLPPRDPVGIDLGLTHLAVLSTGEGVDPPHYLRHSERRLARAQRTLARRERSSHRRERQRVRVARCHEKVARQRKWFAHQLSHRWAEQHDLVGFEDVDAGRMGQTLGLGKSFADAGWGMLRTMTHYKVALRGGRCVEVDARGTTQTCSQCGERANPPLELQDRVFRCRCGHEEDRDVNASRNVLRRALEKVGRMSPELTHGETGPTPRGGRKVYQRRRAGSGSREAGPPATADTERVEPSPEMLLRG